MSEGRRRPLAGTPDEQPRPARTPGLLRGLYREEREAWRRHYRRYFKYAARALGLGFVAGFLYFTLWPAREKKALEFVIQSLKDVVLGGPPLLMALTLFYHNVRASLVAIAAGIVPFLFLPIFDPLLNGAVLGLLVSVTKHQNMDVPRLVLTKILPHGVFELTAVCYATSLGLYLSAGTGRKVRAAWAARRRGRASDALPETASGGSPGPRPRPEIPEAEGLFRNVLRSFVLVVLPLLLVAAFVEAFVTPHLR
jgi:stage II sporulation protein M